MKTKRDYVPKLDKEGKPVFTMTARGPVPELVPVSGEYTVVYVQNLETGEIQEQSTKAARLFYTDRTKFRFLEPKAGEAAYLKQKAQAPTDDAGRIDFEALYELPNEAPRFGLAARVKSDDDDLDDDEPLSEDPEKEALLARVQALEAELAAKAAGPEKDKPKPATRTVKKETDEKTGESGS